MRASLGFLLDTTTPTVTFIERNQNEIDKTEDVLANLSHCAFRRKQQSLAFFANSRA
jgi:hypothetical protein